MNTIIGPSLGYIHFNPFRILILGDYHTPIGSQKDGVLSNRLPTMLNVLSELASHFAVHVFLEDSLIIRDTSETKRLFAKQHSKRCSANTCESLRLEDTSPNGSGTNPSTLRGLNEYLFMCGRNERICPLNSESYVHRIDIRAQLFVQTASGGVIQVTDDRCFNTVDAERVLTSLCQLVQTRNAHMVALKSHVALNVLDSVCQTLERWQKSTPIAYMAFKEWWCNRAIGVYDPRQQSLGFACSLDYSKMWQAVPPEKRQTLLFTICTNAIMDAMCIASMMINHIECTSDHAQVVYVGCAHAELINDYFRVVHTSMPIEATQNADLLAHVYKMVDFPNGQLHEFMSNTHDSV